MEPMAAGPHDEWLPPLPDAPGPRRNASKRPAADRRVERLVFDFETNAWVRPDPFNVRAQGHEAALAAPDTEPAPGRWTRPSPPAPKASPLLILTVCSVVALVIGALVARSLVPTIAATLIVLAADAYRIIERGGAIRATREDLRLLEDPDDPDVCLVALTVTRNGESVGTDRGVAWFEGGRLLYSGHRTSFAIGGEDVLPQREYGTHGVPLRVQRGTARVVLSPLSVETLVGGKQEMRFLKALYAFKRSPTVSQGPRQWPPLDPL